MIHKKIITLVVLGAVLSLMPWTPAWAQSTGQVAALNVRIVDIDSVRTLSTAFKAAREKIMAYGAANDQAMQKEDKALRDASGELNRKRTLLAPEAFAEERKKFEQRVATFQRKSQEQQKSMNKLQLEVISQINNKVIQIITEYADKNSVSLVLPAQSVLLRAESLNIDAHVLGRLNKELPSVTVTLPTQ